MDPSLEHLIVHAERLLTRLEAVLPHAPRAPDWDASVAFRYRRRNGNAVETPVWFAEHAGKLYVFSAGDAGKVKRLRNSPRASWCRAPVKSPSRVMPTNSSTREKPFREPWYFIARCEPATRG